MDFLPPAPVLKKACQSIAILDCLIGIDAQRTFQAAWGPSGEDLAHMDNEQGDNYSIVFTPGGAAWAQGLDHESLWHRGEEMPLETHLHGAPAWVTAWRRVVLDSRVPGGEFPGNPHDAVRDPCRDAIWNSWWPDMHWHIKPTFTPRQYASPFLTTLLWTATGEAGSWEHSCLVPAPGSDDDQSGADYLFDLVRQPGNPGAYTEWAESHYDGNQAEDEDNSDHGGVHMDRDAVASIYAHQPLTQALVTRLTRDPETSLAAMAWKARAIGYPVAGTGW